MQTFVKVYSFNYIYNRILKPLRFCLCISLLILSEYDILCLFSIFMFYKNLYILSTKYYANRFSSFLLFVRGERLFLENVACLPLIDIYFSRMYIFSVYLTLIAFCFFIICSIDVRFLIVYGLYVNL